MPACARYPMLFILLLACTTTLLLRVALITVVGLQAIWHPRHPNIYDCHAWCACRICFEQETAESQDRSNPLICPCMCSGSSKYVHRQCLQQWRETNHRADASYQCEVCKYRSVAWCLVD